MVPPRLPGIIPECRARAHPSVPPQKEKRKKKEYRVSASLIFLLFFVFSKDSMGGLGMWLGVCVCVACAEFLGSVLGSIYPVPTAPQDWGHGCPLPPPHIPLPDVASATTRSWKMAPPLPQCMFYSQETWIPSSSNTITLSTTRCGPEGRKELKVAIIFLLFLGLRVPPRSAQGTMQYWGPNPGL